MKEYYRLEFDVDTESTSGHAFSEVDTLEILNMTIKSMQNNPENYSNLVVTRVRERNFMFWTVNFKRKMKGLL